MHCDRRTRWKWSPASVVSALARVVPVKGASHSFQQQLARIDIAENERFLGGRGRRATISRAIRKFFQQVPVQVPSDGSQACRVSSNSLAGQRDVQAVRFVHRRFRVYYHLDHRLVCGQMRDGTVKRLLIIDSVGGNVALCVPQIFFSTWFFHLRKEGPKWFVTPCVIFMF